MTTQIGFVAVPVAIPAMAVALEVHLGVFLSAVEWVGDDLISVSVREEVYRPRRDGADEGAHETLESHVMTPLSISLEFRKKVNYVLCGGNCCAGGSEEKRGKPFWSSNEYDAVSDDNAGVFVSRQVRLFFFFLFFGIY